MAEPSNRQRLLEHAVERLGRSEVAARLRTTELLVEAWLAGVMHMPRAKLVELLELVENLPRD